MSDRAHAPLRCRSLCVYKYPSLMRYAVIPKMRIIGIFCISITILRRKATLSIRMNAPISLKPFESETNASIWAIGTCGDALGAPSKKNTTNLQGGCLASRNALDVDNPRH
jgi:hypothetical protein